MYTKEPTNSSLPGIIAVCLMLSGPVYAMDETADAGANGSVPVLSGGIGDDELSYIRSVEHEYNLKVVFTESNGVYLSDLPVSITDSKGDVVVNTVTNGPILLVDLPSGAYTVTATRKGISKEEKISVSGHSLRTIQYRFTGNDLRSSE